MQFEAAAATDVGLARDNNEDSFHVDAELGLFIVCDGMGGHAAGEIASRTAAHAASAYVQQHRAAIQTAGETSRGYFEALAIAENAVQHASQAVFQRSQDDAACAGMGTTLTLLLVIDDKAVLAHVGDTRLYLYRQGQADLMTKDHTLAEQLSQSGMDLAQLPTSGLSHVLTQSIGQPEKVTVDTLLFDLEPGDACLLCTDGLSNYFDSGEHVATLLADCSPQQALTNLISLAHRRGANDNLTAIVIQTASGQPAPTGSAPTGSALAEETAPASAADPDSLAAGGETNTVQTTITTFDSCRCWSEWMTILGGLDLFRGFSPETIVGVLDETATVLCFEERSIILPGECTLPGLYVVLDGQVLAEGTNTTDTAPQWSPGATFGHAALTYPAESGRTVISYNACTLALIRRSLFRDYVRRQPQLGNNLLWNLARQIAGQLASPLT